MLRAHRSRLTLVLVAAGLAALPAAAQAAPPLNDNYLSSIPVNERGTRLTEDTIRDTRDTREATVQTDLFAPPTVGGGAERTDCRGTTFGATVWYDFHPQSDGVVRVATAGFDAAVAVYEFDPKTAQIGARLDCSNEPQATEELFVNVKKGVSYTVQVGGTVTAGVPATGNLDFTFEYLADTDGDGQLDALDKCPNQPGTSNGCPVELRVLPTLRAIPTSRGIRISSLSVETPRGARIAVRCGHGCSYSKSRTALKAGPVRFTGLNGRELPAGARVEIFVTKARSIGTYIRYLVTRGNFKRTVRCLAPGSMTPRRSCK